MPKRCIGIDIGRSHLRAAQVVQTAEGFRVEKALATDTRGDGASLATLLRSLAKEHGFDRRADAAVCLPLQAFFFADFATDARGLERIRAADPAELKDLLPIPVQDIVAQVCSVRRIADGRSSVLVAASSRPQLREGLQLLDAGGIKPTCLDTPVIALLRTLVVNHAEAATGLAAVLYVDEAALSLAVIRDGGLVLVRNIPLPGAGEWDGAALARQTADLVAGEIEVTWRRLFGGEPDGGLRLFLIAPREMTDPLAARLRDKIDIRVLAVEPYAHVMRSEEVDAELPLGVATGLALGALQPAQSGIPDFLATYRARTRPGLRPSRELAICAGLAATAVVVWAAGLFLQLSSLEADYGQLKQQARQIFRQAVPEEQNIVDPAAQLQQRLDALGQECAALTCLRSGHPAPLEILYTLSQNIPATGGLQLQDVLIAADSVRVRGSCDSFAALAEWQRLLEAVPGLRVVDVPRPTKDNQSGKVQFTVSLSTREDQA